jgi:DNA polymerase
MPEEEMQPLVDAWRGANRKIVRFWHALDAAAHEVVEEHTTVRVGRVTLFWQDEKMFIHLPSGRRLTYLSPRLVDNRFGGKSLGYLGSEANGQFAVQETFGGKLAENITQAVARDLLAHALMNLEAAGYSIVFHVHDEAVLEVPIGEGSVADACAIMGRAPDWANGLPLRADGYECGFYRKD